MCRASRFPNEKKKTFTRVNGAIFQYYRILSYRKQTYVANNRRVFNRIETNFFYWKTSGQECIKKKRKEAILSKHNVTEKRPWFASENNYHQYSVVTKATYELFADVAFETQQTEIFPKGLYFSKLYDFFF